MATCQQSSLHSCNTIGLPFATHLGKTPKAPDGFSRAGGVGIDDWGFWQAFRASGTQAWRAGQISPRCSSMMCSWRKGDSMQLEACCWQRRQLRAGRRSDVTVQCWWSRRAARDARKRTWTCIIEFGNAVPTQVRSLTRHSISFKKPHKPRTHWNDSGSGGCATILDFARSGAFGVNLGVAY